MALVALTVAFATLGVYPRDSGGAAWFVAWLLSLGCPGSTWPADVDRAASPWGCCSSSSIQRGDRSIAWPLALPGFAAGIVRP
jgi:hypothetical protein